jgi:hypothetical protein
MLRDRGRSILVIKGVEIGTMRKLISHEGKRDVLPQALPPSHIAATPATAERFPWISTDPGRNATRHSTRHSPASKTGDRTPPGRRLTAAFPSTLMGNITGMHEA